MLSVFIEPAVATEMLAAFYYFESCQTGLGARFETAFYECVHRIVQQPTASVVVFEIFRRSLVKPFQYHLYYEVESDRVVVTALLHARRDPDFVHRRLRRGSEGEPV